MKLYTEMRLKCSNPDCTQWAHVTVEITPRQGTLWHNQTTFRVVDLPDGWIERETNDNVDRHITCCKEHQHENAFLSSRFVRKGGTDE